MCHPWELFERRLMLAAHVAGNPLTFATIQSAVDAAPAGGIVQVDPGTYPELVIINKPLTLRGAEAGVDARTTVRPGGEAIVRGVDQGGGIRTSSFIINADNVTLDGFTVQDQTSESRYGAGIILASNIAGTHILNNVVQHNIIGLLLANDDAGNGAVIEHNVFLENNQPGDGTGRGIYTDGEASGGRLVNVSINENVFIRNFGGLPEASREAAIDLHAGSASTQADIRITNNIFDDNGKALLAFNAHDLLITGNVVVSTRDTRSAALRFEGNVHNVTLSGNLIDNNIARGIRIDNKSSPGDNFGFDIINNNIYGNANPLFGTGVNHDGIYVDAGSFDGELNLRNNWWGSSSGPGGDGPGGGDAVYANGNDLAYIPWATAPVGDLQIPYFGKPLDATARIDVVDFDNGGEGVGYHDADKTNRGGQGHLTDGVDVQRTSDPGSGYNIGFTQAGEWLEYTVDVAASGAYNLDLRIASAQTTGGTLHLESDGVNVSGPITVPNTGGWQTWQAITKSGVNLTAGRHVLRLAFDKLGSGGAIANINWLKLTLAGTIPEPPPTSALPVPWKDQDIGGVGAAGSASFANGTYTVAGSGVDIWNNSDSFNFAYQQVSGDGTLIARVTGMEQGDVLAKAGIMVRETLAANSKQVGLFLMPAYGVRFIRRASTGGGSTSATTTVNTGITPPYWLKLTRSGATISAYRSADGVNWIFVGAQQISMAQTIYVGLAVTSHQNGVSRAATFDNVSLG